MHIDFCFIDRIGRGLIAGWSSEPEPSLSLMIGGQRLPMSAIFRFPRRDLGTRQELGLMASFRLRDVVPEDSDLPELVLIVDGEMRELPEDRLKHDEERLVASSVDELFAAYLRAIAARLYGSPRREITQAILSRVQGSLRALPAETPRIAMNLDRLLVSPSGLGVFTGWCLTDGADAHALMTLVSGGRTLNPARIILNSIRREDLAGYRDRYRYTGLNGFCGTFRLPMSSDRNARMVLLSNVSHSDFVFGREAELVTNEEAALALSEHIASLSDPRDAQALMAAAAPRLSQEPFSAPATAVTSDELVVALEPDVAPAELRDVLRLLHAALGRGYSLHLLGQQCAEMARPIAAAVAESGNEIRLGESLTPAQLLAHEFGIGRVVYGSASAFFQMRLPELSDHRCASLVYHDPIGMLPSRVARAEWVGDRNPPFLLSSPASLLVASLRAVPRGFMSSDGVMRAVVDLLLTQGLVKAERAGEPTWYPGTDIQTHPEYGIARTLDIHMRALVGHEERT